MNSTGVAIATSPCQPHHLHCLRVPSTLFLSPSLAPPQGTSRAAAISHEATRVWLPTCPLEMLPPSFQSCLPTAHQSSPDPHGLPKALSSTHPPCPKRQEPQIQQHLKVWRRLVLPPRCAALCPPTPGNSPAHGRNYITSNVCAWKNTAFGEALSAEDRQGGPAPLLHLPGHETLWGATQASRAPGTCRWSGTHCDAAVTPLCTLPTPQEGRKRPQEGGTAGHHTSGHAGPANLGQL